MSSSCCLFLLFLQQHRLREPLCHQHQNPFSPLLGMVVHPPRHGCGHFATSQTWGSDGCCRRGRRFRRMNAGALQTAFRLCPAHDFTEPPGSKMLKFRPSGPHPLTEATAVKAHSGPDTLYFYKPRYTGNEIEREWEGRKRRGKRARRVVVYVPLTQDEARPRVSSW